MSSYIQAPSSDEYYTDSSSDEEVEHESLPPVTRDADFNSEYLERDTSHYADEESFELSYESDDESEEIKEESDEEFSEEDEENTANTRMSVESDDEDLHRRPVHDDEIDSTEEMNSDTEDDVEIPDYSDEDDAQLDDRILEVLDEINYSKGLSKSTFITGICGYTLEEEVRCIQCHNCHDCYSLDGILENHRTGHLPGEPLVCPTCKTQIEMTLLLESIDKSTLLEVTKQQWKETMDKPIFTQYVDTIRVLHEAGYIFDDSNRSADKRSIIKLLYMVKSIADPELTRQIEEPRLPEELTWSIIRFSKLIYNSCPTDDKDSLEEALESIRLSGRVRSISSGLRVIDTIITFAEKTPAISSEEVQRVKDLRDQWIKDISQKNHHPHELIGMVYQQIAELGMITDHLMDFIKKNAYNIFRSYDLPVSMLLDAIIDAMLPDATPIHKKFINEIMSIHDSWILDCFPVDFSTYPACPMKFIQTFINDHDLLCSCGGPIIDGKCSLCGEHYCEKCMRKKEHGHICNNDDLETIKALEETTIRCPKCSTRIQKSEGCDHMFCTRCRCNFDWITGKIITESEQTNTLYEESLSDIEREYSYYIHRMMNGVEEHYDTPYLSINNGIIIYALALEKLGYVTEPMPFILRKALEYNLRCRLNRETAESFKTFIAQTIDRTIKRLESILDEAGAERIAKRIMKQGRNILLFAITHADVLI